VHALRLMELTQRMSSVMRFSDAEETVRTDPLANVLRTFARLYHLSLDCTLAVSKLDNFSDTVAMHAVESGADLTVIPWTLLAAENEEGRPYTVSQELEKYPLHYAYVNDVLNKVYGPVVVVLDRGIGNHGYRTRFIGIDGVVESHNMADKELDLRVDVLFIGGEDDRVALQLAQLIAVHGVRVTVVRVKSNAGDGALDHADDLAIRESALPVTEVASEADLTAHAKSMRAWDLVLIGRGAVSHDMVLGKVAHQLLDANCKPSLMIARAGHPVDLSSMSLEVPARRPSSMSHASAT